MEDHTGAARIEKTLTEQQERALYVIEYFIEEYRQRLAEDQTPESRYQLEYGLNGYVDCKNGLLRREMDPVVVGYFASGYDVIQQEQQEDAKAE